MALSPWQIFRSMDRGRDFNGVRSLRLEMRVPTRSSKAVRPFAVDKPMTIGSGRRGRMMRSPASWTAGGAWPERNGAADGGTACRAAEDDRDFALMMTTRRRWAAQVSRLWKGDVADWRRKVRTERNE